MADAVTIPADLAADVAARPEAYRPVVQLGDEVLGVLPNGFGHSGRVAELDRDWEWVGLDYGPGEGGRAHAWWALVGSVDGGPRPDVGQRVLVLECPFPGYVGKVGTITTSPDRSVVIVRVGGSCDITRWALLPDAAEPAGWAEFEPRDSRTEPFNHRMCGTRHTVERGCPVLADVPSSAAAKPDTTDSRPDLDRLPPGALPASQLHRPPPLPGIADPEAVVAYRQGRWPCMEPRCARTQHGPGDPHEDGHGTSWGELAADMAPFRAAREDALREDAADAEWRDAALTLLAAGQVPDGRWRVGSHAPRNLYIGPPRPYGVDVGRMDSPALAAFVVEAVNRAGQFRAALEHIATSSPGDRRDYARDVLAEADGPELAEEGARLRAAWQAAGRRASDWQALYDRATADAQDQRVAAVEAVNERDRLRAALLAVCDELGDRLASSYCAESYAAARDVLENPRSPATSATLPAENPESVHDHAHAGKGADGHQRETRYGGVDEEPT